MPPAHTECVFTNYINNCSAVWALRTRFVTIFVKQNTADTAVVKFKFTVDNRGNPNLKYTPITFILLVCPRKTSPKIITSLVTKNNQIKKQITTYRKCIPAFEGKHKGNQYRNTFTRTFVMFNTLASTNMTRESALATHTTRDSQLSCLPVGETTARSHCGGGLRGS